MSDYTNNSSSTPSSTGDDNMLAMLVHLSGILLSIVLPLVVWLMNKDKSDKAFLNEQAKEALNFQIMILIGYFIASILMVVLIGFLLMPLLWLLNVVLCIVAGLAAQKGEHYRYPSFIPRLIK